MTCSRRERKREPGDRGSGERKIENGSQAGNSKELADMSHITSGACGPKRDTIPSTDMPAALPHWPGLSHIPAYE